MERERERRVALPSLDDRPTLVCSSNELSTVEKLKGVLDLVSSGVPLGGCLRVLKDRSLVVSLRVLSLLLVELAELAPSELRLVS